MVDQKEGTNRQDGAGRNADRIAELLDQSLVDLPPRVNAGLEAARHEALKASKRRRSPAFVGAWAGGLAASLLLAVGVLFMSSEGPFPSDEPQLMLLTMAEMDELDWALVQDLEFAYWLSEPNNELQSPPPSSDSQSG